MNIGFDIDGVLTNIGRFQIQEGRKYFKREPINKKGFTIQEMFGCTKEEEHDFWANPKYNNLLKYSIAYPARIGIARTIKQLHDDGDNIYIITSRKFTDNDNLSGKIMRTIVKEWLKANKIEYDKIIFCGDSKLEAIQDNYISIMVEDNINNIKELSEYTNIICVDCDYNQSISEDMAKRVNLSDLNSLRNAVIDIKNKNIKNRKDPITVLSGKLSIDKPHMKYYSELQSKVLNPSISIYDYLRKCNKDNLNSKAISYFGTYLSFNDFFKKIDEAAKGFKEIGINKGDIVTVCMPNTPEGVITFYALNKIGAVANMIHPLSSEVEIKNYLNEVNSKAMVMIDICFNKVKSIINETSINHCIVVSPSDSMPPLLKIGYSYLNRDKKIDYSNDERFLPWDSFIKNGKKYNGVSEETWQNNEMAVILHTGGSTGTPKGVMLSNENFNTNVEQLKFTIPSYKKGDSLLAITPIFHGFGLANCVHTALCVNMFVSLLPQYDTTFFTKTLLKDKSNLILGVPTLWDAMLKNEKLQKSDLSFLKVLISGGDNLPEKLETQLNNFLKEHNAPNKVFKGYGMTECLAAFAFSQPNANEISSVGIPLPQNNVKIVKPGTCEEVEANTEGEICINGPSVMLGYYNNIDETNDVLKMHDDNKLWLHTGDVGYRTEDGILYYTQRIKRIIISSGYNIYPNQIEQAIREHEDVKDCAVVGIPHPYKVNVPKAYIVLNDNSIESVKTKEEIGELCKQHLSKFSLPKEYEIVSELPKTLMGKIDYQKLEQENIDKYYQEKSVKKVKK